MRWKFVVLITFLFCILLGIAEAWVQGYFISLYAPLMIIALPAFIFGCFALIPAFVLTKYGKYKKPASNIKKILVCVIFILLILIVVPLSIMALNPFNKINENHAEKIINAIDKFESEEGRYPENLTELLPNYLPEIPKNLWGQNFKYQKLSFHEVWNEQHRRWDKLNVTKYRIKNPVGIGWYTQIYDSYDDSWFLWD